jgi:hypothetical protein
MPCAARPDHQQLQTCRLISEVAASGFKADTFDHTFTGTVYNLFAIANPDRFGSADSRTHRHKRLYT